MASSQPDRANLLSESAKQSSSTNSTSVKPQPASIKAPLKKLTRDISGPSIKSVMNGGPVEEEKISVKEQHELFSRQDYFEPFTSEALIEKWKEYLTTLEDRPSLKATLAKDPVLLDNWVIRLVIDNHVQDEVIRNVKPQLVSWLRRELKNSAIDLVTEVREEQSKRFAYTDGEKFEEMLQKNPDLAYFKQKFNLDFDN